MLKKIVLFSALVAFAGEARCQFIDKVNDPVDFVNPLMGSQSTADLSSGNTYPSIALPWGMNFWTPQTGKNGDGWQSFCRNRKISAITIPTSGPAP